MICEGVVLAAGRSTRAGTNKMLLPWGGKTVLEKCIDGMAGFCGRVVVVVGHKAEMLIPLLQSYDHVAVVFNAHFDDGMFSSVRLGLSCTEGSRVFLSPGDCPLIDSRVYGEMLEIDGDIVVPVYRGRTGHPVLLSRKAIDGLQQANARTLREFIFQSGFVPYDARGPGVVTDIDTPEDYLRAIRG